MTTEQPKPRRTPLQHMSVAQTLAHDYCMSVLRSTATFDMLEQKDGKHTDRLVYLGNEYATKFFKFHGLRA